MEYKRHTKASRYSAGSLMATEKRESDGGCHSYSVFEAFDELSGEGETVFRLSDSSFEQIEVKILVS